MHHRERETYRQSNKKRKGQLANESKQGIANLHHMFHPHHRCLVPHMKEPKGALHQIAQPLPHILNILRELCRGNLQDIVGTVAVMERENVDIGIGGGLHRVDATGAINESLKGRSCRDLKGAYS